MTATATPFNNGRPRTSRAEIEAGIGKEVGVSKWFTIDQALITAFGKLTQDEYFIHMDPVRAEGNAVRRFDRARLPLHAVDASAMAYDALPEVEGRTMGMNYGFDKIRLPVARAGRLEGARAFRHLAGRREIAAADRRALRRLGRDRGQAETRARRRMADHRLLRLSAEHWSVMRGAQRRSNPIQNAAFWIGFAALAMTDERGRTEMTISSQIASPSSPAPAMAWAAPMRWRSARAARKSSSTISAARATAPAARRKPPTRSSPRSWRRVARRWPRPAASPTRRASPTW